MKNFKEMLEKDLDTFYNTKEYAEIHTVEYDGEIMKIPVVFDHEETKDRKISVNDKAEGLYRVDLVVRIRLDQIKTTPRKRKRIYIDDTGYQINAVSSEYGEVILDLEDIDE